MLTRLSWRQGLAARGALAVVGAALPLLLASAAQAAATHNVSINNRVYTPADMAVAVGDTVTWTNASKEDHNVRGGPFSSPAMKGGATYSYTFGAPATVKYVCDFHPTMKGTITVK